MIEIALLIAGTALGYIIAWLFAKQKFTKGSVSENEFQRVQKLSTELSAEAKSLQNQLELKQSDLDQTKGELKDSAERINSLIADVSTAKNALEEKSRQNASLEAKNQELVEQLDTLKDQMGNLKSQKSATEQKLTNTNDLLDNLKEELSQLKEENRKTLENHTETQKQLSSALAENSALKEKLDTQKKEITETKESFNTQFQNIANQIIETNSNKLTERNKENIQAILTPLGKEIAEFKKKVESTYEEESRQRFSLQNEIANMLKTNDAMREETKNLTQALKGSTAKQGKWGEMILEKILETSQLRKGEEYFMEHQLIDEDGNALKSENENKKMRPDAVVKMTDEREVIIDAKTSLNSFYNYLDSESEEEQKIHLLGHVKAIKDHVDTLSGKAYDDYKKSLDFIIMFIPSEPAYTAAVQSDRNLWEYAYNKRILLMNPTNLITSLKIIENLWKRERQDRNTIKIAEKGASIYSKIESVLKSFEEAGKSISAANSKFQSAYDALSTGKGNLAKQAGDLKELGVKFKEKKDKERAKAMLEAEQQRLEEEN